MTSRNVSPPRRSALSRSAAIAALTCGIMSASWVAPAAAQALEKATVRLDFLAAGYHAPFFMALEKGFYRQHGIDLQIADGKGSTATIQVVAGGSDTFGVAALSAVALAIS